MKEIKGLGVTKTGSLGITEALGAQIGAAYYL